MPELKAKLFAKPFVCIDNCEINFPYKKVEALLYYLLVNKTATRTKAASLLWGSMLENNAKKNLRNALYELKKKVGEGVVATPDRSTIKINKNCDLDIDVDTFLAEENKKAISIYEGEFMSNFFLKDNIDFEKWQMEQRNYYRNLYIKKLKEHINKFSMKNKEAEAIYYLEQLIKIDEFNENAYCDLIKLYGKEEMTAKAVKVYQRLEEKLGNELSICPEEKTKQVLRKVKNRSTKEKNRNKEIEEYICHKKEMKQLTNSINNFLSEKKFKSNIIMGEAGIGKTTLLNKALEKTKNNDCLIFETACFQAEERYILKPWKTILQKIDNRLDIEKLDLSLSWERVISYLFPSLKKNNDLVKEMNLESIKTQSIFDALIYLLTEISREYKLLLIFEDLQWSDKESLFLINNLIHEKNSEIMVIATTRNSGIKITNNIFSGLNKDDLLNKVYLKRLTYEQVQEFSTNFLDKDNLNNDLIDSLYNETEGNIFFLVEYLNHIKENSKNNISYKLTTHSKSILRNRLQSVSKEAQKIMRLISVFFDKVSYEILTELSNKSGLELIKIIEKLQEHYIIKEVTDNSSNPCYKFTHIKLRDFIYNEQSDSRKKIIHERIANILEDKISNIKNNVNREDYTSLIYHYQRAGNVEKHVEYLIKEAEIYFNYTHELYPVVKDRYLRRNNLLMINKEDARFYLTEINDLLEKLESTGIETKKLKKFRIKFLHMRSYYLIGEGEYDVAIIHIKKMLQQAKKINDLHSLMKGYEELAILGIQLEEYSLLKENAQNLYNTAVNKHNEIKIAIAKRLLGVANLYNKNFSQAVDYFKGSLQIFEDKELLGRKYTLSKAALLNYLGEVKRRSGNFEGAISYYNDAINMCEKQNISCGLGTFYTNAGIAYYHFGQLKKAEEQFEKAIKIFGELPTIWGYSVLANSYLSLIMLRKGKYSRSFSLLQKADEIIEEYPKRYWNGLLCWIKSEIVKVLKNHEKVDEKYNNYLSKNSQFYKETAMEIFSELGTAYENKLISK